MSWTGLTKGTLKCVGTPIRSRTASGVAGARPEPLPDVSGYGTVLHGSDVRDGLAVRGEDVADADSDVETWLRANGRVTVIEPGVVDTELPTHITHDATREAVQRGYDAATVKPEEVAEIIAFVLARPRHLAINEILLRPTDQLG